MPASKKDRNNDLWGKTKQALKEKEILPRKTQNRYLEYAKSLDNQVEQAKSYFNIEDLYTQIFRLVYARIHEILKEKDTARFGFKQRSYVEVTPFTPKTNEGIYFFIKVPANDTYEYEALSWIMTTEPINFSYKRAVQNGEEMVDNWGWVFSSISETTEMVKRVLIEFYGTDEGNKLRDYSLFEQKKKGCFIATAAYGTPMAEEINVLRFWRDHTLTKSALGNSCIQAYYSMSPPIANFIAKYRPLRAVVRMAISPVVWYFRKRYTK